jgi:protease I
MPSNISGKTIAILATDGFEQSELTEPKRALEEAGAKTMVIAPKSGEIKGWNHTDWGQSVKVDQTLDQAKPQEFDALVLPGGVMNPDHLRIDAKAVKFVRDFAGSGKPIAAICHGPWTLIEAGVVKARTMTSWPSITTDLINAGAKWVDQEVVSDGQFITSRRPDDLPAFNRALIDLLSGGMAQHAAA